MCKALEGALLSGYAAIEMLTLMVTGRGQELSFSWMRGDIRENLRGSSYGGCEGDGSLDLRRGPGVNCKADWRVC